MAQHEVQLPANTTVLRATVGGKDFYRIPFGETSSQPPFKDENNETVYPTLSTLSYTENYIITLDDADYLKDAGNNVYEFVVGSRPKRPH